MGIGDRWWVGATRGERWVVVVERSEAEGLYTNGQHLTANSHHPSPNTHHPSPDTRVIFSS
ncbi:MAG: hypothetical protein IKH22_02615 [Prevotella sp.]|nr:hypothetical protein [Prevotella sp.]